MQRHVRLGKDNLLKLKAKVKNGRCVNVLQKAGQEALTEGCGCDLDGLAGRREESGEQKRVFGHAATGEAGVRVVSGERERD